MRRLDSTELRERLERLQRESFGWALGCCSRDPGEAEAVLQTAYLKVLDGKAVFDGRAAFKTWLFAVIRRTAAERRRRTILRRLRLVDYDEKVVTEPVGGSPEDDVFRSEVRSSFEEALATLAPRQQQVLQLVFSHELSIAEAAEVLGISTGAAHAHYDRGKRRLREAMAKVQVTYATE